MTKPHIKFHPVIKEYSCSGDGRIVFGVSYTDAYANFLKYAKKHDDKYDYMFLSHMTKLDSPPEWAFMSNKIFV